ncbi:hypothetical protein D3C83_209480 [compost metagenome]
MRHVAGDAAQGGPHDPAVEMRHELITLRSAEKLRRPDDLAALVLETQQQLGSRT